MFLNTFREKEVAYMVSKSLSTSRTDVERCLSKDTYNVDDLVYLLSPASSYYLEDIAKKSLQITQQRFGRSIQLFAPLYLSNECYNHCTYCGFGIQHNYKRITLSTDEILKEADHLLSQGISHILLLTGEAPKKVGRNYISKAIQAIRSKCSHIGIEIQPMSYEDYRFLITSGADSLTLYQETYHSSSYAKYHLSGFKKSYQNRLIALENGAKAGFNAINIGVLLGLYDWRFDCFSLAKHLTYLYKYFWKNEYAVSFPRITDMYGSFNTLYPCSEADLVKVICSFRLVFPDCGITLSTREAPSFRDGITPIAITSMSAASVTSPGGYVCNKSVEQFETHDKRSVSEVVSFLKSKNIDPVFKNWDYTLSNHQ